MSDIAAAFDYAGDLGCGSSTPRSAGGYRASSRRVIAAHPNTLYVVAAGNDAEDADTTCHATYPCALPQANIICVGATDSRDQHRARSPTTARPPSTSSRRASSIRSTYTGTAYAFDSAARRWPRRTSPAPPRSRSPRTRRPTTSQLKCALLSSVDAKPAFAGKSVTGGRLNARAAVNAILGPLPDAGADGRTGRAGRPRRDADAGRPAR